MVSRLLPSSPLSLPCLLLILTLVATSLGSSAWAQGAVPDLRGPVVEVRVEGTSTYADIVRTLITTRTGTPAERIDLEAERNRVYGLGTFASVSVSLLDEPSGPVLRVRVEEHPSIGEIVFDGVESVQVTRLRTLLAREHLLESGRVYNEGRAQEAARTVADAYRAEGFPFDPVVTLETESAPEMAARDERAPLRVRYRVDEVATVESIAFDASSVLSEDELRDAFEVVEDAEDGAFELARYRAAVEAVGERYAEQGFRQSGVDLQASRLRDGVLTVRFRELRIGSIDTTPLGIDASDLSLEPGDLFDYDTLLADVRRVAEGRSGDVRLVPRVSQAGTVRVTFELGPPDTAGEITGLRFEGNTVLDDEALTELLTLRTGDTFTSTLAEEDFRRIAQAYSEAGYLIANQPDYNWLDGTYVQRVTEFRVGAYELVWNEGDPTVEPFVVRRELPDEGEVLSLDDLDDGLRKLVRDGAVRPVDRQIVPLEEGEEDEVLIRVVLERAQTGLFQPAATYSTADGFSANLSVSERNLWGRGHAIEGELDARTSPLGFLLGGSVRYTIPWLYLDFADLQEVPTNVSTSLFSNVRSNQPLSDGGTTRAAHPDADPGEANRVAVGSYTRRDTGLSLSAGRPLGEDFDIRAQTRATVSAIAVEPPRASCEIEDGNVVDPESCSLPWEAAASYAPIGGLSGFLGTDLTYDARDSAEFPRDGVAGSASVGVGFGNDFQMDGERRGYAYLPVEVGAKSYITLADLLPDDVTDRNHVLAARLNLGHQIGGAYPADKRFMIGRTPNEATQVRGYRDADFDMSRTYATASFEYRYDFELTTIATQTVIAIAFADLAWASGVPGFDEYATPVFGSAGVGLQVNLGFSGVQLPALRFDYGFSERNPTGVFAFRVGTVF
ncbi:MAG: POTRA domain-containing protein [Trueperaceae bacterium]